MQKLTIKGVEIEFDDNIEISVEGKKVTVKAKVATFVVHEYYPFCPGPRPFYPATPYWVPQTVPSPGWPIITCGNDISSTVGNTIGPASTGMLT